MNTMALAYTIITFLILIVLFLGGMVLYSINPLALFTITTILVFVFLFVCTYVLYHVFFGLMGES
mgnify:FL=1